MAALVENKSSECRCASCGRDVRINLDASFAALHWKRCRSSTGMQKTKLVAFSFVCSEICAHRLARATTGKWGYQKVSYWLGPNAFREYADLLATYWVSRTLRKAVLPRLLYNLSATPCPNVIEIRPDLVPYINEAREALGETLGHHAREALGH